MVSTHGTVTAPLLYTQMTWCPPRNLPATYPEGIRPSVRGSYSILWDCGHHRHWKGELRRINYSVPISRRTLLCVSVYARIIRDHYGVMFLSVWPLIFHSDYWGNQQANKNQHSYSFGISTIATSRYKYVHNARPSRFHMANANPLDCAVVRFFTTA